MGCGPSKESSLDQNQNLVGNQSGHKLEGHQQKLRLDDANLNSKIDSPSSIAIIELVQDEQHFERLNNELDANVMTTKQTPGKQRKKLSIDSGVTADAWTTGKIKSTGDQVNLTNNIENDSEFGRDGIDFYSSSVDGTRNLSGQRKPSPRGIQAESEQHETDDVPRLTKRSSEEPFDPTPLVDVNKFKAVNAPRQQVISKGTNNAVTMETTTPAGTVTMETRTTAVQSGPTTVVSPTNYQDYYDEDEKALMESIEQDFTETYTNLPGVVA